MTYHRIRLLWTRTFGTTVPDGTVARMLEVIVDLLVGRRDGRSPAPAALYRPSATRQAATGIVRLAFALALFRRPRRFFWRVRVHLFVAVRRTFGENNHRISTEKKRHLAAAVERSPRH